MELLIINSEDSEFYDEDELAIVKTAVIFAEKTTVVNYNFKDVVFYCHLDKMTDKQLNDYYLNTLKDSDIPEKEEHIREGERMYRDMVELKKMKFKDRNMLIYLGQLEKNIVNLKKSTEKQIRTYLEDNYNYPLVNFYNDKTLNIIIHDPTEEPEIETIPDRLIKAFTSSDAIQFFDEFILSDDDYGEDASREFLSETLFEIPDLNSLSYTQLKLIRNELMEKYKPFYETVDVMVKEFSRVLFNKENQDFIEKRTSELLDPHFAIVRDTIENNIYIQQIQNRSHNNTIYTLHFCVASIAKVVGFYEERKIITADETKYVLENIALQKDIATCCFFFYNYSNEKEDEE